VKKVYHGGGSVNMQITFYSDCRYAEVLLTSFPDFEQLLGIPMY
jgi:hypothetical protein